MERNYQFRERMLQVHTPGLRDDLLCKQIAGTVIDDSWEIIYPKNCERVIRTAALDLQEFFQISMELYPRLRAVSDINASLADASHKIILTDATLTPDGQPAYTEPGAYRLSVTGDSVVICGVTGRGTAQGVYYIENRMGIHRGPVLVPGEISRRPLFSPRMVHSGFGLDQFPDAHISAIAHAGMDALLVFVKDVHITPQGHLDLNDLIYRAAGYGVDVYAYSYYKSPVHPEDPNAREFYESTYGRLFEACPGLRGVTLVGESVEFPSHDERTTGCLRLERKPGDTRPSPGWWPCRDYPQWVSLVRDIIREKNPNADFVFWSYNWGYVDREPRLELIRNLPTDISLNVTYEMFETFHPAPGVFKKCVDYTLSYEGPGQYFVSEAEAAHERGIRLYTMANTGGLSWDIGVVPFEPAPYQWKRRYDGMVKAYYDWGLRGVMESHHFGFYPSFVSELANVSFWEPAVDYDNAMREIAARDYGVGNEALILDVWKDFSEGIRCYVPTNPDQYGPFRIGPAYPLLFEQPAILESPPYAHFGNNHITNTMYSYDPRYWANIPYEIECDTKMAEYYDAGCEKLASILPGLEGRQLENARRLLGLGRFIRNAARTTVNVKEWYMRKCRLLPPDGERPIWAGGDESEKMDAASAQSLSAAEVIATIDEMRAIAAREIENARDTIPYVEYDSRLGYEPSMEYMCDRAHLEWKIEKTQRALAELEPIYDRAKEACAR